MNPIPLHSRFRVSHLQPGFLDTSVSSGGLVECANFWRELAVLSGANLPSS